MKKTAQTDTTPDSKTASSILTEESKETAEKETPVKAEAKETVETVEEPEEVLAKAAKEEVSENSEKPKPEEAVKEEESVVEVEKEDEVTVEEVKKEKTVETVETKTEEIKKEKSEEKVSKSPKDDEVETKPEKKSFFFSDVPAVDMNAPLKSDGSEENDDLPDIEKSNKKLFVLGASVFIATIIITCVAGFFFLNGMSGQKKAVEPKEEKTAVATPTPTVAIKREEWTFEVLNGSGVAGAAAKASDKLTTLGYKVVKTGNADDATGNTLFVIAAKKDEAKAIVEDLKKDFGDITIGEALTTDTKAVARLVIGK